jgi:hypothetical protein
MPNRPSITINARLRPMDGGDRYEDPLRVVVDARMPRSTITGAGTL